MAVPARAISNPASAPASLGARPLDPTEFLDAARGIERQVTTVIVGQAEVVRGMLICLIAGGHALLEGVPGVGKTTLARAFAAALDLSHARIQFTPDLMPADITGTTVLVQDEAGRPRVEFQPGPLFAGLVRRCTSGYGSCL
jgi:MoxR-like ATPase